MDLKLFRRSVTMANEVQCGW